MTKQDIIKKAYSFRGANREFSQEMGPLVEGMVEQMGEPMLVVDDVTDLTSDQAEALKAGNVVVKTTGDQKHTYIVAYKDEVAGELSLVYADAWNVEEVYYEKGESGWAFVVKETTHIGYQRAQLVALCEALVTAGVVTSYTIGETPTNNVYPIEFTKS